MKLTSLLIAGIFILAGASLRAAEPIKIKLAPAGEDRRYVAMSTLVGADALKPPFVVRDADGGQALPCQWEPAGAGGYRVYWLLPQVAKGQAKMLSVDHGEQAAKGGVTIVEKDGSLAISSGAREITRYNFGGQYEKFKKPYFYPLMVGGTNLCRGFPMDPHPGESNDHPHHTGIWFAHGEVNNVEYWSKEPIKHDKFIVKESGPVMAHLIADNRWGENVIERQDVCIYDIGDDLLMDWAITLTAVGKPVELGKTKEGGFSVRVATELTSPEPGKNAKPAKDRGDGKMVDALGNQDEPPVREHAAPWADNYGVIGGKTVGVALMNHPQSWRYPTNWHVRNYGLFAANAFFVQGSHTLEPGKPITLRYRLYAHGGDPKQAGVQAVYAGYAASETK